MPFPIPFFKQQSHIAQSHSMHARISSPLSSSLLLQEMHSSLLQCSQRTMPFLSPFSSRGHSTRNRIGHRPRLCHLCLPPPPVDDKTCRGSCCNDCSTKCVHPCPSLSLSIGHTSWNRTDCMAKSLPRNLPHCKLHIDLSCNNHSAICPCPCPSPSRSTGHTRRNRIGCMSKSLLHCL